MSGWRQRGLALALFAVLAVAHTWPLAAGPGRYSRNDNMDAQLNEWTMAWVAHQAVHDPVHLFDANIFYPEKHTLAFSEYLVVESVMAMPLFWAGASPVAAFNIVLIAGFALTGWAMALVMHRWTRFWPAAILSGCLIAFNASTLSRLVHIQAQHLEFFPLMLLALDEVLARPRAKAALALAGWFVLESLTSVYFLVFMAIAAIAAVIVRPADWLNKRGAGVVTSLTLAGVTAAALLSPFLWAYYRASREQSAFTRPLDEVALYSARWPNYLAAAGTLHTRVIGWSHDFATNDYLFPGVIALLLTVVALVSRTAFTDRRARMALGFGIVSLALSFGPAFPLYPVLYKVFPLLQAIRGAARFGQMALAAISILAGFGLAWLSTKLSRSAALAVGIAAIIVVNVEAWRAPIGYCGTTGPRCDAFTGIPPIFRTLDRPDVKAVVAFPFYRPDDSIIFNARYMLQSTANWKPMLNGYSGYMPASTLTHYQHIKDFPSDSSIAYLKGIGISHALVDARNMPSSVLDAISASPLLTLENTDGNLQILRIK
jgi:hypothetical protein